MKAPVVVALLCAALSACSATAYSDRAASALPDDRVGILKHDDPLKSRIVIESIDGAWRGVGVFNSYRLSPGTHSLGVRVNAPYYSDRITRCIDVSAGGRYSIEAVIDPSIRKWGFWIIDLATHQPIDYEPKTP